MNDELGYLISFECKDCGWDWMGTFVYCPNCRGSNASIIEYESMEQFAERMVLMQERDMEEVYFILEELDFE